MKYVPMSEPLYSYLVAHGHNRDPLLAELAAETETLGPIAMMQIAPEQGTLMSLLVRAIGATSALEIGTFTGYSALCIARGYVADPASRGVGFTIGFAACALLLVVGLLGAIF